MCEFRRALSDLQQQLVLSIECREVNKIKLEAKYKVILTAHTEKKETHAYRC